jgi:hyaluronoglucosaminidase
MTSRRRRPRTARASAALVAAALVPGAIACSGDGGGDRAERDDDDGSPTEEATDTTGDPTPTPELTDRADPLPVVTPTPRDLRWLGPDVAVTPAVTVVAPADADAAALAVVTEVLEGAGATDITTTEPEPEADDDAGGLIVRVGSAADADLVDYLGAVGVDVPPDLPAEGYALAAYGRSDGSAAVVIAGADGAGTFYAAQTLRQLAAGGAIAGVGVVDHPAMRHRGTIEGFYGSPWTTDERLDQLAFHGRFKLNTYVYAPKDDPYHRDRWREPYPADRLADLHRLVDAAAANHVRFTFAVSPGVSICYSDPADLAALEAKLQAMYDLGVRTFSIALDDIDHTRWNCDGDAGRYGPPSAEAAAQAQAELLNALQPGFVAAHPGAGPLQMVPTEYRGTRDSPYRTTLRSRLDPAIEVMWTGAYVVPDEITVAQAGDAAATFGRSLYVWDNTPVNDFPATEGRLILAPYARREPGLSAQVTGVVLNPMNQAAASKVQLVGGADFTWNDTAYDPARAHRAAAAHLADGDDATVEALLAFFDLENLAPTSARSGIVSQPQSPALAAALDSFRATWEAGDRERAIGGLRPTAERIAGAPALIRAHVTDPGFVADCAPWLDATALWGQALVGALDGLAAAVAGDDASASAAQAMVDDLAAQASAIETIPGETLPQGPVRVGDGVLDAFLAELDGLA